MGIKTGMKKIAKGDIDPAPSSSKKQIAAATIIETTTMLMWSESNREVADAVKKLTSVVEGLMDRIDLIDDLNKEARELRHQIERLRDKMT